MTRKTKYQHCSVHREDFLSTFNEGTGTWTDCPCCQRLTAEEKEAVRKELEDAANLRERQRIKDLIEDANIPWRFTLKAKSFEDFIADTKGRQDAVEAVRMFLAGDSEYLHLILSGKPGTGKTHLLCILIRQYCEAGFRVEYLTHKDIIRRVRDTWASGATETESQAIRRLVNCDVLVVDEVGAGTATEAEQATFFEIIDGRYRECAPVVIASNLDKKALAAYIGERAFDRLREGGLWVPFAWESHRGPKGG